MKIAFDVKGTLVGHHQEKVRKLFHYLVCPENKMFVWSNSWEYAYTTVEDLNLLATPELKKSARDLEDWNRPLMDIAIEDDKSQTWLGAKKIIWVDEIPDDVAKFAKKLMEG
jgi:hypothetical protein